MTRELAQTLAKALDDALALPADEHMSWDLRSQLTDARAELTAKYGHLLGQRDFNW